MLSQGLKMRARVATQKYARGLRGSQNSRCQNCAVSLQKHSFKRTKTRVRQSTEVLCRSDLMNSDTNDISRRIFRSHALWRMCTASPSLTLSYAVFIRLRRFLITYSTRATEMLRWPKIHSRSDFTTLDLIPGGLNREELLADFFSTNPLDDFHVKRGCDQRIKHKYLRTKHASLFENCISWRESKLETNMFFQVVLVPKISMRMPYLLLEFDWPTFGLVCSCFVDSTPKMILKRRKMC